jgi:hypothetical protein
MNRVMQGLVGLMAAALLVGCGQETSDKTSGVELTGSRPGEIAIIPQVTVDGLEQLTNRTAGTVFVEEVLLNAAEVRLWENATSSRDLKGASEHFLLRYNPSAGEAGLTRLWTPANGLYSDLTLDVGPLRVTEEQAAAESRVRGFDLTQLRDASVVIKGQLLVDSGAPDGWTEQGQSLGSRCSLGQCEGTVPDTAPAAPRTKETLSTVPDTAPAKDEVTGGTPGMERNHIAGLRQKTYRPFYFISAGRFAMGVSLDPVVAQGGGAVRFHLDVNSLFSDDRLADLQSASRTQGVGPVVQGLRAEDISRSINVNAGNVDLLPGMRPR